MLLLLAAVLTLPIAPVARAGSVDPGDLVSKVRELRLSKDRYWRLLLHYEPSPFGFASGVRTRNFFLSPKGRKDPEAEIEALAAALAQAPAAKADDDVRCRFPLRSAWLGEKLGLKADQTHLECPRYKEWREVIHLDSATLIFASAYLNNPSSMYGHTFLRLDQDRHKADEKLLDYAVNYAANTNTNNGVLFAVYGITGQYPGGFSATPYYMKVQEYTNLDSRDLWEYRLNLDPAALDRLAQHLWELDQAEFGYYFFNKNCAYQMLPLLEVADPRLKLVKHWSFWVLPPDTLKTIARQPGFVAGWTYRPSRLSMLLAHRSQLANSEVRLAKDVALSSTTASWRQLQALPPARQALVLDASAEYLGYLDDFDAKREATDKENLHKLLVSRGKLGLATEPLQIPEPIPPHEGHGSERATLGYGFGDRHFIEASYRGALQDLLDPIEGYWPNSALEMGNARIRQDLKANKTYVENFEGIHIVSLSPLDPWIRQPSWKLGTGWRTAEEIQPHGWAAGYYGFDLGTGVALEGHLLGRETFSTMAEADSGVGKVFRYGYRAGGGGSAVLLWRPCSYWATQLEAGYRAYAVGDPRPVARYSAESQWTLTKSIAVRTRFSRARNYDEGMASLVGYF